MLSLGQRWGAPKNGGYCWELVYYSDQRIPQPLVNPGYCLTFLPKSWYCSPELSLILLYFTRVLVVVFVSSKLSRLLFFWGGGIIMHHSVDNWRFRFGVFPTCLTHTLMVGIRNRRFFFGGPNLVPIFFVLQTVTDFDVFFLFFCLFTDFCKQIFCGHHFQTFIDLLEEVFPFVLPKQMNCWRLTLKPHENFKTVPNVMKSLYRSMTSIRVSTGQSRSCVGESDVIVIPVL